MMTRKVKFHPEKESTAPLPPGERKDGSSRLRAVRHGAHALKGQTLNVKPVSKEKVQSRSSEASDKAQSAVFKVSAPQGAARRGESPSHGRKGRAHGLTHVNLALNVLRGRAMTVAFAFMGSAFGFVSLAAYIHQVERTTVIPYLVTVDAHGVILGHGEVKAMTELPSYVVAAEMATFVRNVRQVSPDPHVQKQAILNAYSHVLAGDPAERQLDRYFREHNPFDGEAGTTAVEVSNVILQQGSTYQVDFTESVISRRGTEHSRRMRAMLTCRIAPSAPDSAEKLLLNPLSVYVSDFSVSEIVSSKEELS